MKVIGITGGVGAGKSEILKYIKENCNCRILYGDEIAHEVQMPGEECYKQIVELLGTEILSEDFTINRLKMAECIFSDKEILKRVNGLVHPAVKKKILEIIDMEGKTGLHDIVFIEAALLIEDGYQEICDELWYIYTREEVRRERLRQSRHYSDEKITSIMEKQGSDAYFRKYCKVVIDNSDGIDLTYKQIRRQLEEE